VAKPIIYQILPRLWGNLCFRNAKGGTLAQNGCGKFSSIDDATLDYLSETGFSHLWVTGVLRHATAEDGGGCIPSSTDWVKGRAGSFFAITDYYDVNPYLAEDPAKRMKEFESMVGRIHAHGLKVIIDFVPNHVARDYQRFRHGKGDLGAQDDGSVHWRPENDFFYYPGESLRLPVERQEYEETPAKASGNVFGPAPGINDWCDTVKLNYCDTHTATWDKMLDVVRFWAGKGVDGFRCDMVELVPAAFSKWMIENVKRDFPDVIFIAEVYQKQQYGRYVREVGFDYLYDKSCMYDTLAAIVRKNVSDSGMPVEQWQSTMKLTWNWQELSDLQPHMLSFLENHDEQRLASPFFAKKPGNAFAALHTSLLFNTSAFMLYAGEEAGEDGMEEAGFSKADGRTTIYDWWSLPSMRHLWNYIHGGPVPKAAKALIERHRDLIKLASSSKAVTEGGTYDLGFCNQSSDGYNRDRHFLFLRHHGSELLLVASNFSSVDADISVLVPAKAFEWMGVHQEDRVVSIHVPAFDGIVAHLRA